MFGMRDDLSPVLDLLVRIKTDFKESGLGALDFAVWCVIASYGHPARLMDVKFDFGRVMTVQTLHKYLRRLSKRGFIYSPSQGIWCISEVVCFSKDGTRFRFITPPNSRLERFVLRVGRKFGIKRLAEKPEVKVIPEENYTAFEDLLRKSGFFIAHIGE